MILAIVGRVGLGLLLALVLSFVGVWVAWGLYYFFTDTSSKALRDAMFLSGAGVGAALGGGLVWLRIDGNRPTVVLLFFLVGLIGGLAGSWMGYEYGLKRAVECCAQPPLSGFSYGAFGATMAANAGTFLLGAAREIVSQRR